MCSAIHLWHKYNVSKILMYCYHILGTAFCFDFCSRFIRIPTDFYSLRSSISITNVRKIKAHDRADRYFKQWNYWIAAIVCNCLGSIRMGNFTWQEHVINRFIQPNRPEWTPLAMVAYNNGAKWNHPTSGRAEMIIIASRILSLFYHHLTSIIRGRETRFKVFVWSTPRDNESASLSLKQIRWN